MGNQLGGVPPDLPSLLVDASSSLCFRRVLGGGKLLKTLQCLHANGSSVVVKIYVRRSDRSVSAAAAANAAGHGRAAGATSALCKQEKRIHDLMQRLSQPYCPPCVLPFTHVQMSSRAAFLIRPFIAHNLYDRLHTRPFLSSIEKRWYAYVLLRALEQLHARQVCHGDLKSENVLLSSSGWLLLADLASYKPTLLPDDNPADFHFFFDSGQRRRCYIAPERFQESRTVQMLRSEASPPHLTEAMDVFSCGCIIAEIFLEGEALFDLPQLLAYKTGRYDPNSGVRKLPSSVRELVTHMIALDPKTRGSAEHYLRAFQGTLFPAGSFKRLYGFLAQLRQKAVSPDEKVQQLRERYHELLRPILPASHRAARLARTFADDPTDVQIVSDAVDPITTTTTGTTGTGTTAAAEGHTSEAEQTARHTKLGRDVAQLKVSEPPPLETPEGSSEIVEELLPLLTLVFSCIRCVRTPTSKLKALDIIESLTYAFDDSIRLGRVVPYLITLASDSSALVRAASVRLLTRTLSQIETLPPSDAHIFPEYIFPSLSMVPHDPEELVRLSFAQDVASLAETARRFLAIANFTEQQALRDSAPSPSLRPANAALAMATVPYQGSYDADLEQLHNCVSRIVGDLLNTNSSKVKMAMLSDIARLAVFFGRVHANSWLLPMLITVLNDRDWQLRAAFFDNIAGFGIFVGRASIQNFILPCLEQALFDMEENVVVQALKAVTQLIELGLLERHLLAEIGARSAPLLCHPNTWIRRRTLRLIVAIRESLGVALAYALLGGCLRPFIRHDIYCLERQTLLQGLRAPLSRAAFERALAARLTSSPNTPASLNHAAVHDDHEAEDGGDHEEEKVLEAMAGFLDSVAMNAHPRQQNAVLQAESDAAALVDHAAADRGAGAGGYVELAAQLYAVEVAHTVPLPVRQVVLVEQYVTTSTSTTPTTTTATTATALGFGSHSGPVLLSVGAPSDLLLRSKTSKRVLQLLRARMHCQRSLAAPSLMGADTDDGLMVAGTTNPATSTTMTTITTTTTTNVGSGVRSSASSSSLSVRLSASSLSASLLRSLSVPPPPPDLGAVRVSSLSTSWVFANHGPPLARRAAHPASWRPRGVLVAELREHAGAVNELAVARDNTFMASASNDGSVRVWDAQRLERSVSAASQLTYNGLGGRVTSLCVCDSSHSVAAASSNGNVHVVRVEATANVKDGSPESYVGVTVLAQLDVRSEGAVVAVRHCNRIAHSLLWFGSERGRLHAFDLRARDAAFRLQVPERHGALSQLALGPSLHSVVSGSARGFVNVFDVRFGVPVNEWRHSSRRRIASLTPCPITSMLGSSSALRHMEVGPLLMLSTCGSDELTAFDLYTGEARERYIASASSGASRPTTPSPAPSPAAATAATAPALVSVQGQRASALDANLADELDAMRSRSSLSCCRAGASGVLCCPGSFVMSAGWDRVVRFWDVKEPSSSYRISSDASVSEHCVYSGEMCDDVSVLRESVYGSAHRGATFGAAVHRRSVRRRGPEPPPTAHNDVILDMKALEFPKKLLLTSGRDGCIKAWV